MSYSTIGDTGNLVYWQFGVLAIWCIGNLVYWQFGVLAIWCIGNLVYWQSVAGKKQSRKIVMNNDNIP